MFPSPYSQEQCRPQLPSYTNPSIRSALALYPSRVIRTRRHYSSTSFSQIEEGPLDYCCSERHFRSYLACRGCLALPSNPSSILGELKPLITVASLSPQRMIKPGGQHRRDKRSEIKNPKHDVRAGYIEVPLVTFLESLRDECRRPDLIFFRCFVP